MCIIKLDALPKMAESLTEFNNSQVAKSYASGRKRSNLYIEQQFKTLFQVRNFMERWTFFFTFADNKNETFCEAIQIM